MMLNSFLLEPLIALMWRTRRYLADATAVQLTRDPDGLGSALTVLERSGGVLPGGRWAVHMFIVGSEIAESRVQEQLRQRAEALKGQSLEARIAAGRQLQQELLADLHHQEDTSLTGTEKSTVNFHPPLDKRLKRLSGEVQSPAISEDLRKSLEGQLEILQQRMEKRRETRDKLAFLDAELVRIEEQVELLREQAVMSTTPHAVSERIDHIAGTLTDTQQWVRDQQQIMGNVDEILNEPPPMVVGPQRVAQ